MRTEFGVERSTCDCKYCVKNCQFMPGFLIPADLTRMIPEGENPFTWASENLLASPGALVMRNGAFFRVPTLVPKTKNDGSCIHLIDNKCNIHQIAPFGCAFFSCQTSATDTSLSSLGIIEIMKAHESFGLYAQIWMWLDALGLRQVKADILRERMKQTL